MFSKRGFGLVEVMVASVILLGLSLGIYTLIISNAREVRSISLTSEFITLVSTIQNIVEREPACIALLAEKDFTAPSGTDLPLKIDPPISASPLTFHGTKIAEIGLPTTGLKVTKLEFDKVIDNTLSDVIVGGLPNKVYMVNFHLEAEKVVGGDALGRTKKVADFPIYITVNPIANRITTCSGSGKGGGAGSTSCSVENLGALRYIEATDSSEYCSKTGWKPVGSAGICDSSVSGGCTKGSSVDDNALTSCGTVRTWKCAGKAGEKSGPCSFSNPKCAGGLCSSVGGVCLVGTPTGDSASTACGTTRSWTCVSSGGPSGLCTASNPPCLPPGSPINCVGSWGACSKTCSPGGKQTFLITQTASSGGTPCSYSAGETRDCKDPVPPSCPPPDWNVTPWSTCSNICTDVKGAGTRTRSVNCAQGAAILLDSECKSSKPTASESCIDNSGCKGCLSKYSKTVLPHKSTGLQAKSVSEACKNTGTLCPAATQIAWCGSATAKCCYKYSCPRGGGTIDGSAKPSENECVSGAPATLASNWSETTSTGICIDGTWKISVLSSVKTTWGGVGCYAPGKVDISDY